MGRVGSIPGGQTKKIFDNEFVGSQSILGALFCGVVSHSYLKQSVPNSNLLRLVSVFRVIRG